MEFGDGVSATTAIAKCLVSGYGYINKRNFKGNTALDVVERLAPSLERVTIEKILRNAGASRGSLLSNDCTLAEFLISKISCLDLKGISLELRNIVLVVVVLIVTATYQAALSPPGGLGGCGGSSLSSLLLANRTTSSASLLPNSANITHVNVTILASTDKLPDRGLILIVSPLGFFYAVNTMAFIMSMGMAFFALPEIFLCIPHRPNISFNGLSTHITVANVVVPGYHFGTYWFVLWPCDNRIHQQNDEHSREPLPDATTFSEEQRS